MQRPGGEALFGTKGLGGDSPVPMLPYATPSHSPGCFPLIQSSFSSLTSCPQRHRAGWSPASLLMPSTCIPSPRPHVVPHIVPEAAVGQWTSISRGAGWPWTSNSWGKTTSVCSQVSLPIPNPTRDTRCWGQTLWGMQVGSLGWETPSPGLCFTQLLGLLSPARCARC